MSNQTSIFHNLNNIEIKSRTYYIHVNFVAQSLDVDSATAVQVNRCISSNRTCLKGACDPLTGECACSRGRKPVHVNQWETICINSE